MDIYLQKRDTTGSWIQNNISIPGGGPLRTPGSLPLTSISDMPYPFTDVDPTDLPIAVETVEHPDRLRQDLFNKLHWRVFSPQNDIAVHDGDALDPFADHSVSSESIADPPASRITARIQVCEDKSSVDHTDEEEYRYKSPESLVIEKRDEAPILFKDFIDQVHPFLNDNKDEIYRCEDENYSQPTELEVAPSSTALILQNSKVPMKMRTRISPLRPANS